MALKARDNAKFPNSLLVAIGLLALLLPLTIVVVQQQSTIRSQAAQDFKNGVKNPPFGALGPCNNPVDCPEPTIAKISDRPQEAFPATNINQPTKKLPDEPCKKEDAPIDGRQPLDNYGNKAPDQGNYKDQKYSYDKPKKKTKKKGAVRKGVNNFFDLFDNNKSKDPYNNAPDTSYPDEKQVYKDNNKNPGYDTYKAPEKKPENNGYNTYPETPHQKQPYEQNYDPNGGQTDPYKNTQPEYDQPKYNQPEYTTNNTYNNKDKKTTYPVAPKQDPYAKKTMPTVYQQPDTQKNDPYKKEAEPTQYSPKKTTYTEPNKKDAKKDAAPDQYTNTTASLAVEDVNLSTHDKPHWQPNGGVTGNTEALIKLLVELLNLIIKALGGQGDIPSPNFHDPCGPQFNVPAPQPQPIQPQPAPSNMPSVAPSKAQSPSSAPNPSSGPQPSGSANPSSSPSSAPKTSGTPSSAPKAPSPAPSQAPAAKTVTFKDNGALCKQEINNTYTTNGSAVSYCGGPGDTKFPVKTLCTVSKGATAATMTGAEASCCFKACAGKCKFSDSALSKENDGTKDKPIIYCGEKKSGDASNAVYVTVGKGSDADSYTVK